MSMIIEYINKALKRTKLELINDEEHLKKQQNS